MIKKGKNLLLLLLIIMIIFLAKPYIKAEILTHKYGEQFRNLYEQTGFIDNVKMFKVLNYADNDAVVYYDNSISVFICYFSKSDEWELYDWKCVWAKDGNANEWIYPYYPHTKEDTTERHIFK